MTEKMLILDDQKPISGNHSVTGPLLLDDPSSLMGASKVDGINYKLLQEENK